MPRLPSRPVSGNLVVDDVQTFWEKVKNVFRHYDPKKQYRVLIQAVPELLGSAELYVQFEETVEEFADRSAPLNASNNHCEGEREHGPFTFSVQGGPEWNIVRVRPAGAVSHPGNQQRSVNGPFDLTPKGFRFMAKLKNGGDCGPYRPLSSDRFWVDARARGEMCFGAKADLLRCRSRRTKPWAYSSGVKTLPFRFQIDLPPLSYRPSD